jgi:rSAM/selenodomain-associated transferase 2
VRHLSIIVPVLNEAGFIVSHLSALQSLRALGSEVIVVDGGSDDGTVALAGPLADRVLTSARGRATQMNAGATCANGEILLFLHADCALPADADRLIFAALAGAAAGWGRFDIEIDGRHPLLPLIAWSMNRRSRLTGIATGDQAIFVRRDWFVAAGGFPEIALMEDIALSAALRRRASPCCLDARVRASGRRWERQGVVRTILLMWWLRFRFFFGTRTDPLAMRYERR